MRISTFTLAALIIQLSVSVTYAQDAVFDWAKSIGGSTNSDDGYSIAVDAAGNVYTTGRFHGTVDFDPGPATFNLTAAGSWDIFVSKLDASGNLVWAKSMGGTNSENSYSIAVDAAGNVYTTGLFSSTADFDPGPATFNLTPTGLSDIFISKLNADGELVWVKNMGGTSYTSGRAITVDAAGNVYTTGYFFETTDFDPGPATFNLTWAGTQDIFISKLDADGNFVWAKSMLGASGNDFGASIAVDASGNVYTTGYFFSLVIDFDPGPATFNLATTGSGDVFISKLDADGNFVWAKSMGGTGNDGGSSIALDLAGNIYTTGSFNLTADFDPGATTFDLTSAGSQDIFISKLDADGNFIWAKSMGGTSFDNSNSIAVDAAGDVYTTGNFQGTTDFDPGPAIFNLTATGGSTDIFISKLNAVGDFVWAKSTGGTSNEVSYSIAVNAAGYVYTTGYFQGTADFDPGSCTYNLSSAGNNDIFVLKLRQGTASPSITSFTPATGSVGTTITITGTGFSTTPANNGVRFFNNITATVTASTATSITTSVPAGASTGKISVTVNCTTVTSADDFVVTAAELPTITSFTPSSGPVGTTVTITGTNFSTTPASNTVQFNGTTATVTASTATSITASVTAGASTGKITVTVAGNMAASEDDFTVTTITNQPPVIIATTTVAQHNNIVTLSLLELISDPDDNLDLTTIQLMSQTSEQGAAASLDNTFLLTLDYMGVPFSGTDHITISACDLLGECVEQDIAIEVTGELDLIVYNAVSPHKDQKNDFFFLQNIELFDNHKVTIYNRWGDEVFQITNYNNADRAFTGLSKNGNELPSGIYFYKIEFSSGKTAKTGYLSLRH